MLEPSDKGAWLTAGRVILEELKWAVLPEKAALYAAEMVNTVHFRGVLEGISKIVY